MIDEKGARRLLEQFDLPLTSEQISQLLAYMELLIRWNGKINLTSIRTPEEIVTRHFGESFYLAHSHKPRGQLLDVGSGAGFPGLALKIVYPDLQTTLLEPVAKKRAFLKEVARACGFASVVVRPERIEDFTKLRPTQEFDTITARAVGHLESLVCEAEKLLRPDGKLCLWLGRDQANLLGGYSQQIQWLEPMIVPLGREREIWVGRRLSKGA